MAMFDTSNYRYDAPSANMGKNEFHSVCSGFATHQGHVSNMYQPAGPASIITIG